MSALPVLSAPPMTRRQRRANKRAYGAEWVLVVDPDTYLQAKAAHDQSAGA